MDPPPGGQPATLQAADPADLPPGLASVDWRIDPGAEELLALEEGPELIGREAATAYLQERWAGRTGRVAVRIDSSMALAVDLDHPSPAEGLVEYLGNRASSSPKEEIASLVQVLLTTHTFDRNLALFEDSIILTTSLVVVLGSGDPVTLDVTWLDLRNEQIVDVSPLALRLRDGRLVRQFDLGVRSARRHLVNWDGANESGEPVASGIYYVVLEAEGNTLGRTLALLRDRSG